MESPGYSPPHVDASRPSLGFPLGTALLLIIIFSLSGIFSCCYHWDKLRSLRRAYTADLENPAVASADDDKPKHSNKDAKANQRQSVPVLMPGDNIPKFIALPCPCEPPREDNTSAAAAGGGGRGGDGSPKPPVKPPRLPVPLY